ncbi:MAG: DUF1592 domain-containing protein, partial [Verrucomicrobiae bacterium]|nr:DUF1592 domain-containing protein [Verrucomicrobiae bacterium]
MVRIFRVGGKRGRAVGRRLAVACAAGLLAPVFGRAAEVADASAAPKLFERYCFDCHGDGMDKGSFALDRLIEAGPGETNRFSWVKTWTLLRHGFMPPADADPLPAADRQSLARWIEQQRLGVDPEHPDPGRVTVRRLNRMEYEFTIQDLFGFSPVKDGEFSSDAASSRARLRDLLPPDDTAFGFDNNGDFQTLSPALLEKYFDLAEFVVDQVIVRDGPRHPMRALDAARIEIARVPDSLRVGHQLAFEVERPGRYRVDAQFPLGGWQDYGGAYDFALSVDEQPIASDRVEIGGQRIYRFGREIALPAGPHQLRFTTDPIRPASTGKTNRLELRPKFRLTGPLDGEAAEYPESHRQIFFAGPAPADSAARHDYARDILKRVADRAFRRPADAPAVERLTDLAMSGDSFESGVGLGLMAILTSPQFIFRTEMQPLPDDPKSVHPLDEYALASRLSYLLWLSLPDAELTGLADRGELRRQLPGQVRRMLADSKSERFFEDFPGQWLRTRNVLMTPIIQDGELNPVRGAMKRETEMLFEHLAREDRDLLELLTADYTFVDAGLAKFYGLTNFTGTGFQQVSLP